MDRIKVLVADDIEETRKVVAKILNMEQEDFEIVGEASNGEEVIKAVRKVKPDVVLMDINMPVLNGLEATERISNEFPNVIVIIMSVQGENEYLKKAMFCGAKEYIIKPFNYDSLVHTIKSTYDKNLERMQKQGYHVESKKNAKIISIFSSKGGVGKSVLAVNSAVSLSRSGNKKVLLLDMDLQFGDISMLINKFTEKTMLDAIDEDQLDNYEDLKNYLYKYNSELDILFAPRKPEAAEYISKGSIEKMIDIFRKCYDVILIDTGINFNETTLYILDASELILFVSTMEIVSLKNTKLGLSVMQSLGYDNDKVKLIINKFTSDYGINKNEVEDVFKDGIFAMIPNDENTVSTSVNKGEPFCDGKRYNKSKIAKAVEGMCSSF